MMTFTYTIDGEEITLATNNDGSNLFVYRRGDMKQIAAGQILYANRTSDQKYCRRAVYSYYRRHFLS